MRNLRAVRDDEGMTLVELLVTMTVLVLVATGVLGTIDATLKVQGNNTARTQAALLASRFTEQARLQLTSLQDINKVPTAPTSDTVFVPAGCDTGGTLPCRKFSVSQDFSILPLNGSVSTCDTASASKLAYVKVSTYVSWPGQGSVRDVRSDTLVSLPIQSDLSSGVLAVPLRTAKGAALANQLVTLQPGSATVVSGKDGCALFPSVGAGKYSASLSSVGYVDPTGETNPAQSGLIVAPAKVTLAAKMLYDRSAGYLVSYNTAKTAYEPPPSGMPLTLSLTTASLFAPQLWYSCGDTAATPGACLNLSTGDGFTNPLHLGSALNSDPNSHGLFPFSAGQGNYQVWAGTCNDAQPAYITPAANLTPGGTGAVTVQLAQVDVRFLGKDKEASKNRQIYAVHPAAAGCPAGYVLSLGPTDADGLLSVGMPYGLGWVLADNPVVADAASVSKSLDLTPTTGKQQRDVKLK